MTRPRKSLKDSLVSLYMHVIVLLIVIFSWLMAAYAWWHLRQAFCKRNLPLSLGLAAAILFMTYLPYLRRMLFPEDPPAWLTKLGWMWLAWIFWFACSQLLPDLWNLTLLLLRRHSHLAAWRLSWRAEAIFGLAVVVIFSLWGYWEAGAIRVREIHLKLPGVPPEADGYRIMFFSDIHIRKGFRTGNVDKLLAYGQQYRPDLLLSGGDFLDGKLIPELETQIRRFREIPTKDGFYAVFGNHDAYQEAGSSLKAHLMAGATVFFDQELTVDGVDYHPHGGQRINDWLFLGGIDDIFFHDPAHPGAWQEKVEPVPEGLVGILLKHQPKVTDDIIASKYALMLSGHTHGGQIFPFGFLTLPVFNWTTCKLHETGGPLLYVTPGAGCWGMPFRVAARPEVVFFILHSV